MKVTTKTQLAILFLALACFIGVVTALIVNSIVTNQIIFEAQERVKEHLSSARWVYESKVRDIDKVIRWTSIRHVLKEGIKRRDLSAIQKELLGLMSEEGLDFLTLTDRRGTVLCRFHNPGVSADTLVQDPFIKAALGKKGLSGTQVLSGDELLKEGKALAQKAVITSIPTPKEKPSQKVEETSGM